ncbi:MAG: hypothetical protein KGV56_00055 [Gammaproteobacteria bacterium]|nr:hypothetical protein [Gammaproteobacteria bacterium]
MILEALAILITIISVVTMLIMAIGLPQFSMPILIAVVAFYAIRYLIKRHRYKQQYEAPAEITSQAIPCRQFTPNYQNGGQSPAGVAEDSESRLDFTPKSH